LITDYDKLSEFLIRWIGDYTKKHGLKCLVVGRDDSYSNLLTVHLCLESRRIKDVHVFWVGDNESEHNFVPDGVQPIPEGLPDTIPQTTLADVFGGIVVSDISATRASGCDFHKYRDVADIYPLRDVLESDVKVLAKRIVPNCPTCPDYSDTENMEWAMKEDLLSGGIITNEIPPQQNKYWFRYTIEQKRILSKNHARHHATKHKELRDVIFPVIPDVLNKAQLI
jgi:hypothetical protein